MTRLLFQLLGFWVLLTTAFLCPILIPAPWGAALCAAFLCTAALLNHRLPDE